MNTKNFYLNIEDEDERFETIEKDTGAFEAYISDFCLQEVKNGDVISRGRDYDAANEKWENLVSSVNKINCTEEYGPYFLQKAIVSNDFNYRFFAQQICNNFGIYYDIKEVGQEIIITEDLMFSGKYQLEYQFYSGPVQNKKGIIIYPAIRSYKIRSPFDGSKLVVPAIIKVVE